MSILLYIASLTMLCGGLVYWGYMIFHLLHSVKRPYGIYTLLGDWSLPLLAISLALLGLEASGYLEVTIG